MCGTSLVERQAPVAQLDRALDYESRGREFESLRARHLPGTSGPRRKSTFLFHGVCTATLSSPNTPSTSFRHVDKRFEFVRPNARPLRRSLSARGEQRRFKPLGSILAYRAITPNQLTSIEGANLNGASCHVNLTEPDPTASTVLLHLVSLHEFSAVWDS
jgi:hypothetical protein